MKFPLLLNGFVRFEPKTVRLISCLGRSGARPNFDIGNQYGRFYTSDPQKKNGEGMPDGKSSHPIIPIKNGDSNGWMHAWKLVSFVWRLFSVGLSHLAQLRTKLIGVSRARGLEEQRKKTCYKPTKKKCL